MDGPGGHHVSAVTQTERETNNVCYHLYVESKKKTQQTSEYHETEADFQSQRVN